jgi:hypothetical protein
MHIPLVRSLLIFLLLVSTYTHAVAQQPAPRFAAPETCKNCHAQIYDQYTESMHTKSYNNPLFKAQFATEILPKLTKDKKTEDEAMGCVTCHAPTRAFGGTIPEAEELKQSGEGITCDFCHTLTGITKNREFISDTEGKKLGPLKINNWHSKYSSYISSSTFCAVCHNAWNRNNVEIKSTYSEWKRSKYAANGIECQDCHMSSKGYLSASGKAEYASGKAAYLSALGQGNNEHAKLFSHRFPGAHSKTQVESALKLRMGLESTYSAGTPYMIAIFVDNSKAGHSMPTGSTDLRMLWLELVLHTEKGDFMIPMPARDHHGYDTAGGNSAEAMLTGTDIPKGSRVYRTVFGDQQGKPIASAFDAFSILFDNRLKQSEMRREEIPVSFPTGLTKQVRLEARLKYQSYPSALAARFGITPPHATVLASAEKVITLVNTSQKAPLGVKNTSP